MERLVPHKKTFGYEDSSTAKLLEEIGSDGLETFKNVKTKLKNKGFEVVRSGSGEKGWPAFSVLRSNIKSKDYFENLLSKVFSDAYKVEILSQRDAKGNVMFQIVPNERPRSGFGGLKFPSTRTIQDGSCASPPAYLQKKLDELNLEFKMSPPVKLKLGESSYFIPGAATVVIDSKDLGTDSRALDTLVHEFGHALYEQLKLEKSEQWNNLYLMSLKCSDYSSNEKMYNQLYDESNFEKGASKDTGHPYHNPSEFFASVFHGLYHHPEHFKTVSLNSDQKKFHENIKQFFTEQKVITFQSQKTKNFSADESVLAFCDLVKAHALHKMHDFMGDSMEGILTNSLDVLLNMDTQKLSTTTKKELVVALNLVLSDSKYGILRDIYVKDKLSATKKLVNSLSR